MGIQQEISDKDITGIGLAAADRCAHRIGRTLRLPVADISDVRQDLLLELVRRASRFDGQASWSTFTRLVIRHAGQDVADRLMRDRRRHGGSFDDSEQTSEDVGLAAWWAGGVTGVGTIHLRLDLQRFVDALPHRLRHLCRLLIQEDRATALVESGFSRSEFFRQIHELRMRLRAHGLTPWDDQASPSVHNQ